MEGTLIISFFLEMEILARQLNEESDGLRGKDATSWS
jgi:hypothetical protein